MIEIKADQFPIRRCIYCKDQGEENIFILSDRWDRNSELNSETVVGAMVHRDCDMFEIIYDDSSVGLGAPECFQLIAKRLSRIDKIKHLRQETGVGLLTTKVLLDNHEYDEAKQMIMDVLKELDVRGGPEGWSRDELGSLPNWKRQIINGKRRKGSE